MGFLGIGGPRRNSAEHEQAERNGQRAWEELQETREELQGELQGKTGHVRHKADKQAHNVREQMGLFKWRAGDAMEQGKERAEEGAEEASGRASDAGVGLKRKAERGVHAVVERARNTGIQLKDKAGDTAETAKEKAWRTEDEVEKQAQRTKQGVKSKWWEKKEKADRVAEETAHKTRDNIRSAEQTAAEKAEEAKGNVQYGIQRAKNGLQGTAETTKERAAEAKERVEGKGQQLKRAVGEKVGELEEGAESVKDAAVRTAEDAKRTAAKPVWWLGKKADQGADKVVEGMGAVEGAVQGAAQEVGRAGKGLGARLDRATDKVTHGTGYGAGYGEGTVEEVAHGAKRVFTKVKDTVGDDLKVPIKKVETPFISIRSRTLKELLAGGAAGAIAQSFAAPLEVVRTKLLGGRSGDNVKEVVKSLARDKGKAWPVKQTSGSFGLNVLRVALEKGVELVTYEKVKTTLKRRGRRHDHQIPILDKLPRQVPESTWAGAAAGVASTLATYPFQTLKDRVLIMPEKYKGFGDALKQVMSQEGGIPALYRGVFPSMLGIVPQAAVNYYTYDRLREGYRRKHGRKDVPPMYTLVFGATAGAVSQLATYPLEVARKQVSLSVLPAVETGKAANAAYKNIAEAVAGVWRTEGVGGLYKGAGAQVAQIIPVAGLTWVVFEAAKRTLQAEEEDED